MSNSFTVDPAAISTCASQFDAQVDPIAATGVKLESAKGTAATAGKAYGPQGQAYNDGLRQHLEKIIRDYSEKAEWVSANLSATATAYTNKDEYNDTVISSSGKGA